MAATRCVECHFCGGQVDSVEVAINEGWLPSFYEGQDENPDPVCQTCAEQYLEVDSDGCDVLKVK